MKKNKKKKMLEIDNCSECKYVDLGMEDEICEHPILKHKVEKNRVIPSVYTIPDWCPLPDKEDSSETK